MKDKTNLIVGLLVAIFILLLILVTVALPVKVNHHYFGKTTTVTRDYVKIRIDYTVNYSAPIVIPKEIKRDVERKIRMYANMRISIFIREHTAIELKENKLSTLQTLFDAEDLIGDIIKNLGIPDVSDKINNIKSIKLNFFIFEEIPEIQKIIADSLQHHLAVENMATPK